MNGPREVYVDTGQGLHQVDVAFAKLHGALHAPQLLDVLRGSQPLAALESQSRKPELQPVSAHVPVVQLAVRHPDIGEEFAGWLRVNTDLRFHPFHKDEGVPFLPNELYRQIVSLAGEPAAMSAASVNP